MENFGPQYCGLFLVSPEGVTAHQRVSRDYRFDVEWRHVQIELIEEFCLQESSRDELLYVFPAPADMLVYHFEVKVDDRIFILRPTKRADSGWPLRDGRESENVALEARFTFTSVFAFIIKGTQGGTRLQVKVRGSFVCTCEKGHFILELYTGAPTLFSLTGRFNRREVSPTELCLPAIVQTIEPSSAEGLEVGIVPQRVSESERLRFEWIPSPLPPKTAFIRMSRLDDAQVALIRARGPVPCRAVAPEMWLLFDPLTAKSPATRAYLDSVVQELLDQYGDGKGLGISRLGTEIDSLALPWEARKDGGARRVVEWIAEGDKSTLSIVEILSWVNQRWPENDPTLVARNLTLVVSSECYAEIVRTTIQSRARGYPFNLIVHVVILNVDIDDSSKNSFSRPLPSGIASCLWIGCPSHVVEAIDAWLPKVPSRNRWVLNLPPGWKCDSESSSQWGKERSWIATPTQSNPAPFHRMEARSYDQRVPFELVEQVEIGPGLSRDEFRTKSRLLSFWHPTAAAYLRLRYNLLSECTFLADMKAGAEIQAVRLATHARRLKQAEAMSWGLTFGDESSAELSLGREMRGPRLAPTLQKQLHSLILAHPSVGYTLARVIDEYERKHFVREIHPHADRIFQVVRAILSISDDTEWSNVMSEVSRAETALGDEKEPELRMWLAQVRQYAENRWEGDI